MGQCSSSEMASGDSETPTPPGTSNALGVCPNISTAVDAPRASLTPSPPPQTPPKTLTSQQRARQPESTRLGREFRDIWGEVGPHIAYDNIDWYFNERNPAIKSYRIRRNARRPNQSPVTQAEQSNHRIRKVTTPKREIFSPLRERRRRIENDQSSFFGADRCLSNGYGNRAVVVKSISGFTNTTYETMRQVQKRLDYDYLVRLVDFRRFQTGFGNRECMYEWCDYGTLQERIDRHPNGLPEPFIWHVLLSLLKAAWFLHSGHKLPGGEQSSGAFFTPEDDPGDYRPIVHNSINPRNVFFQSRAAEGYGGDPTKSLENWPNVKLGNFSKAKLLHFRVAHPPHFVVARRLRTGFEAPEHSWRAPSVPLTPGRRPSKRAPYGTRADIWSIGMVALAMMGYNVPRAVGHLRGHDHFLDDGGRGYSNPLRQFVHRFLLEQRPAARPDAHTALKEAQKVSVKWRLLRGDMSRPENRAGINVHREQCQSAAQLQSELDDAVDSTPFRRTAYPAGRGTQRTVRNFHHRWVTPTLTPKHSQSLEEREAELTRQLRTGEYRPDWVDDNGNEIFPSDVDGSCGENRKPMISTRGQGIISSSSEDSDDYDTSGRPPRMGGASSIGSGSGDGEDGRDQPSNEGSRSGSRESPYDDRYDPGRRSFRGVYGGNDDDDGADGEYMMFGGLRNTNVADDRGAGDQEVDDEDYEAPLPGEFELAEEGLHWKGEGTENNANPDGGRAGFGEGYKPIRDGGSSAGRGQGIEADEDEDKEREDHGQPEFIDTQSHLIRANQLAAWAQGHTLEFRRPPLWLWEEIEPDELIQCVRSGELQLLPVRVRRSQEIRTPTPGRTPRSSEDSHAKTKEHLKQRKKISREEFMSIRDSMRPFNVGEGSPWKRRKTEHPEEATELSTNATARRGPKGSRTQIPTPPERTPMQTQPRNGTASQPLNTGTRRGLRGSGKQTPAAEPPSGRRTRAQFSPGRQNDPTPGGLGTTTPAPRPPPTMNEETLPPAMEEGRRSRRKRQKPDRYGQ